MLRDWRHDHPPLLTSLETCRVSDLTYTLFATEVAMLVVLLAGVLWSIAVPDKRIWPPPCRRSW